MAISKKVAERFISGDMDAAGVVFEEYKNLLYFTIATYVGNRDDCDDLLSETFLKALEHRKEIRDPKRIRAYLVAIATNEARQYLRKQRVEAVEYVDDLNPEEGGGNAMLDLFGPSLSNKEVIVVYYKAVFSYTWEEIEKETGIPISTAKRLYARAKEKLKDKL